MGIKAAIMVPHPPLIIPDVGKGDEKKIQATIDAYNKAARMLAAMCPDTVVVISPHQIMYADYFHISPGRTASGDFSRFGAGQVSFEVTYDTEFVEELCHLADDNGLPAGTMGERDRQLDHGTMVPLYFINQYMSDYKIVRIGLSGMPLAMHYSLGQCIKEAADRLGRDVVIVASGDLSHKLKDDGPYGYDAHGPEYDGRIMDVMGRAAFGELFDFSEGLLDGAAECGHRSFVIMAGAFDKTAVTVSRLSYEGTFGVGYGVCTYKAQGDDMQRNFRDIYEKKMAEKLSGRRLSEDDYVRLARRTIEEYIGMGRKISVPENLPPQMYGQRAGTFVSIKKEGSLRGCIGTIGPVHGSVAEEIIENAISAAVRDPRFSPIKPEELSQLTITVDVLGDTERIDSPDELDVKRYGVIVTKGGRRGLLLPNLEGVDTVSEQIAIAKRKAGIGEDEDVMLERFEVVRHY